MSNFNNFNVTDSFFGSGGFLLQDFYYLCRAFSIQHMKSSIKTIAAACALLCFMAAGALDLPVTTVNGRQYYYYRAGRGESVHGISKKLGITRARIIEYNPGVADGVRRGEVLYFPVEEFADSEAPQAPAVAAQLPDAVSGGSSEAATESTAEAESTAKEPEVLVALPFGLEAGASSRQNRHALDFYKGFLIAADTLSNRMGHATVRTVDSSNGAPADSLIERAAIVILPEQTAVFDATARRCAQAETYVMNLFATRDSSYLTNPWMIQANIPTDMMYVKAIEGLRQTYPGYTPVIIRNRSGRNEKEPFTQALARACAERGQRCLSIEYSGNITTADLASLEAEPNTDFVIVPSSGTLAEFNKFAYVIRNFRDSRIPASYPEAQDASYQTAPDSLDSATSGGIALFGYPDWMAFRSDAEELLHAMEVTVYSRYYDDYDSFTSRNINNDFVRWYGEPMIESIPSQGLLGYDAGCFILKNLLLNGPEFRPAGSGTYRGVQSTFRFERIPGGGYVNTALYIVRFHPFGRLSATVL